NALAHCERNKTGLTLQGGAPPQASGSPLLGARSSTNSETSSSPSTPPRQISGDVSSLTSSKTEARGLVLLKLVPELIAQNAKLKMKLVDAEARLGDVERQRNALQAQLEVARIL